MPFLLFNYGFFYLILNWVIVIMFYLNVSPGRHEKL